MISLTTRIIVWMVSGWLLGSGITGITYDAATNSFTLFEAITVHLSQIQVLVGGAGTTVGALVWRLIAKRNNGKL